MKEGESTLRLFFVLSDSASASGSVSDLITPSASDLASASDSVSDELLERRVSLIIDRQVAHDTPGGLGGYGILLGEGDGDEIGSFLGSLSGCLVNSLTNTSTGSSAGSSAGST